MVHIIIVPKDEPRTPSQPGENITKRIFGFFYGKKTQNGNGPSLTFKVVHPVRADDLNPEIWPADDLNADDLRGADGVREFG